MTTTVTSHGLVREGAWSAVRRALTSPGSAWPEPTVSIGRKIGKFGSKGLCWEAVGPAREVFNKIRPRLKEHLESGVETISSWVTWSMYMIGKTPECASPTILFCCEVPSHRKLVRNVIKESGILDKYPGIKTADAPRPPDFNQLIRLAEVHGELGSGTVIEGLAAPHGNACGMELTISAGSSGLLRSRRATVGGVIQLGERYFYFTAEHAFQIDSEEGSDGSFSDSYDSENDSDYSIDEDISSEVIEDAKAFDCAAIGKLNICHASKSDGSQDEPSSIVSNISQSMSPTEKRAIKQTVRLSSVAISSGADPATTLDYSLIEVFDANHQVPNPVHFGEKELSVSSIVTDGPRDTTVLAITSRGVLPGRLSGTSMCTSMATVSTYQEVYYGVLDSPLEHGDCGSWIIDANTGDLFGHIIAGSPETGAAMIIPALLTFTDLEDRAKKQPKLPTAPFPFLPYDTKLDKSPTTQRKHSVSTREFTEDDIAWTKSVTAKFVKLLRQKQKEIILRRYQEPKISAEDSSTANSLPPSYDQTISDMTVRERFRRKFPLIPEPPAEGDKDAQKFRNTLDNLSCMPLLYEDAGLQDLALAMMPLEEIYSKAAKNKFDYEKNAPLAVAKRLPPWSLMDCSIIAMMSWFKNEFFTWVNNPPCSQCQSATLAVGMTAPTAEESALGASRVELYRCSNIDCSCLERFPRYRDPGILLRTRRGRVGEWANCFALFCRALGARVRWVWTANDHVFIEFYSESQRRWVHADPCENTFDLPRLYSEGKSDQWSECFTITNLCVSGWGKTLTYAIAFSVDGATDVTRRYVRKVSLFRQSPRTRCSEGVLLHILQQITALRRSSLGDQERARLRKEDELEQVELGSFIVASVTSDFMASLGSQGTAQSKKLVAEAEAEAEAMRELRRSETREA